MGRFWLVKEEYALKKVVGMEILEGKGMAETVLVGDGELEILEGKGMAELEVVVMVMELNLVLVG